MGRKKLKRKITKTLTMFLTVILLIASVSIPVLADVPGMTEPQSATEAVMDADSEIMTGISDVLEETLAEVITEDGDSAEGIKESETEDPVQETSTEEISESDPENEEEATEPSSETITETEDGTTAEEQDVETETSEEETEKIAEFESGFIDQEYIMIPQSNLLMASLGATATTANFWADPNYGDADVLYYGTINGVKVPAYCIDHGKWKPDGSYSTLSSYASNMIGYVMKNGYPNTNWGLSNSEAQYLTQVAVYGVLGVPLYDISDGMMPPSYIYDAVWGNGHFYIAENLIASAKSNATSTDAKYASFWTPANTAQQRLATPTQMGKLKLSKTVKNGTGSLVIKKTTTGSESDKTRAFTFTLKVTSASGTVQKTDYSYSGSKTGTINGNSGTVTLYSGQSITVSGIPAGYKYTVTETADSNYTPTPSSRTISGTIASVGTSDKEFTFTVTFSNGSTYSYSGSKSGTLKSGGKITLKGGQSITFADVPAGVTYKVTETAVSGYTASASSLSGTVSYNTTSSAAFTNTYNPATQTASFTNARKTATLSVTKKSSATGKCAEGIKGNSMYSQDFSDAVFSVRIYDANSGKWGAAKNYSPTSAGLFQIKGLYVGDTVEITETKAPKGYVLPATVTQTKTLVSGNNAVTFTDDPTFDPRTPAIYKARFLNGQLIKSDPVKDAVFKMEYFDNTDRTGNALRTWYFKTDVYGRFEYGTGWLAPGYTSDELYVDKNGLYDIPLGSVRFTEVEAPKGFLVYEGYIDGTITQNPSTGLAEFQWVNVDSDEILIENGTLYIGEKPEPLMLPLTGSHDGLWMLIIGLALIITGAAVAAFNFIRRKGIPMKKAVRLVPGILAGLVLTVSMTIPAFAAGDINIVSKNKTQHTYNAYCLIEGTYIDQDTIWNSHIPESVPEAFWNITGRPDDRNSASQTAGWLSEKISSDTDGNFAELLERTAVSLKDFAPCMSFESGTTVTLPDGYYLIVSDVSHPVLRLIGGGETLTIYEKADYVPDHPKTGDESDAAVYICVMTGAFLILGATIFFIIRKCRKEDEDENQTE